MGLVQDRLVTAALVLAESAWLAAVFGLLGLMLGGTGSPLGWIGVVSILGVSLLLARFLSIILMPAISAYIIQMIVGVIVIYLTVGAEANPQFQGVDLGWIGNLGDNASDDQFTFRASMAALLGALLWWRGGRLASVEFPVESLSATFKIGILLIAFVALVDIFNDADLEVFPMMFLFFASGLAGMSIGHLMPTSQRAAQNRAWTRVIGGVIAGVVMIGFLLSLLQGPVLAVIAVPFKLVLNALATVIFFVIILPIGYIVDFIIRALARLFGNPDPERLAELREGRPGGFAETLQGLQDGMMEEGGQSLWLQIAEWTLLAIIIVIALFFLARAFRKKVRWNRNESEGERESVAEDVDPATDLARLLFNLLPKRFRTAKRRYIIDLPDGEPGVVDVFRLYYGMLTLAEDRGIPRPATATPSEYRFALEQEFPPDLVNNLTNAFNRACYGHLPASSDQIHAMRVSLESLAEGKAH